MLMSSFASQLQFSFVILHTVADFQKGKKEELIGF